MLRYLSGNFETEARPGLFVDRDGVLNARIPDGYVTKPSQLEMLEFAIPALHAAVNLGYPIVIVSNQGGISQGFMSEGELLGVMAALLSRLLRSQVEVAGIYVCPHHPKAIQQADRKCACRKPAPGLLLQAACDLHLDLSRSALIGDQSSDADAGLAAGLDSRRLFTVGTSTRPQSLALDVITALQFASPR
jgi:D-glycero-D-manno-heptose 1,7-bisphosphate phosphatase